MNWALAIDRNRRLLLRIVASLFVSLGIEPDGSVDTLPRSVRNGVLWVLRPSESALRRLVVIYHEYHKVTPPPLQPARGGSDQKRKRGKAAHSMAFRLIDPRRKIGQQRYLPNARMPRISTPGYIEPVFTPQSTPSPDDYLSAKRLCLRVKAMLRGLNDLQAQAERLARWNAKRDQEIAEAKNVRLLPIRLGTPPGYRARQRHEIDEILVEIHRLAHDAMEPQNSS